MRDEATAKPRRVLGYARVSSREQALGTSLTDQQNVLQAYAQARSLKVASYFVEAESAVHEKFERREKMQQLMSELRAGDLVLCDKLDRWSRDPEFTYRSMREIREKGARVYFVGEQLDPTTPEGDSMLGMRVMMSREEWKRIKLRTVGTRKLLRNQGLYVEGLPPIGYKRQLARGQKERGVEKNVLMPDKVDGPLVGEFFKLSSKGWSIGDLVVYAKRKSAARKWDKRAIGLVLRSRIYIGEIKDSRGVWIKGRHEALVSAELFAKTQAALDKRRHAGARAKTDSRTRAWLLRGIARCAKCGARMGSAYGGGFGGKKNYVDYYRCAQSCGAKYVPVNLADDAAAGMVLARLTEIRKDLASAPPVLASAAPTADFAQLRARLEQRRDRLLEARLDGHLTRDEFNGKMAKLDVERTKIDAAESNSVKRPPLQDEGARRALLESVSKLRDAWFGMSPEGRRDTVLDLAAVVKLERGKPPVFEWRSHDDLAEEMLPET